MKNNSIKKLFMATLFLLAGFAMAGAQNVAKEKACKNAEVQIFASTATTPGMPQALCPEPAPTVACSIKTMCGENDEYYSANCSNPDECNTYCCDENCCDEDCCDSCCFDDACCEDSGCAESCTATGCTD